jgi:hypothetical protein
MMKLSPRLLRRASAAAAATAAAILIPATALAAPARPAAPQGTAPGCTAGQLVTWAGVPGAGTAGTTYFQLEFSNVSPRACSLLGYPGVSAADGSGAQLGSPAFRAPSRQVTRVFLARGATAHAIVGIDDDLTVFMPSSCRPVTAAALRVFAPNDFTAHLVPLSFPACQHAGPVFLVIWPVTAGTGIPGFSTETGIPTFST